MSVTLERPTKAGKSAVGVVGLPQVNLLPPEVRAARGLVHLKRWLAIGLVGVLVLAGLVYAFALMTRATADAELADTVAENARLQTEQAKYVEVPVVLNNLKRTQDARVQGMSSEILWKPYIDAISAVLPAGVSIDSFTVSQSTPWLDAPMATDPLLEAGVGSIIFTVRTSTLPDSSSWIDALNSIPGFTDATVSSAAITDEDGVVFYDVTSSVQLLSTALSNRFAPTEEN